MKNFRAATPDDAAQIHRIYLPYVEKTAITFEVEIPSVEDMAKRISEILVKYPWLVCEIDDQIVGYAYAGPYRTRCAYAWSLESAVYVHQDFHGQGVGGELYQRLFAIVREQGAVNIFAGITLPNNASIALHERLGFVKVAHMKDVGFKLGHYWDVGFWQLQLQKPLEPKALRGWLAGQTGASDDFRHPN